MALPPEPVNLSVDQVVDLTRKLATLRHDINNHLSLIIAASELIRHKPEMADRMMVTLNEQPPKITAALSQFTSEFEQIFRRKHF